jgi:1-deoxy-D-xylulose-5-phosphate synthase
VEPGWYPHGTRNEILADLGLTPADVARQITGWMAALSQEPEPEPELDTDAPPWRRS